MYDLSHCLVFAPLDGPPDERYLIERIELHEHIRGRSYCGCPFCLDQLRRVRPEAAAEAYHGDEPSGVNRQRFIRGVIAILRDKRALFEDKVDYLIAGYLAERRTWLRRDPANDNRAPSV